MITKYHFKERDEKKIINKKIIQAFVKKCNSLYSSKSRKVIKNELSKYNAVFSKINYFRDYIFFY